ncbi:MAG: M28 family peptidase, partial [Chitinophagaceae bacterium]|nr:M28 family peptidase [Chitinophagaceae bacterium]
LLSNAARTRLKSALAKGPVKLKVSIKTRIHTSEELTVVADVHGMEKPDERFVFSAHVQEPGANDNASGVGTLAEMARVTAAMVQSGKLKPGRSLTFLWGDEIVSTRRYIREDSVRALGIKWGCSLDMVGEDTKKTGGTFLIEKMPDPSAVWTRGNDKHSEWGGSPLPESAIVPHYFNDLLLTRCLNEAAGNGWVVKTNPFEGGSDHTPFLNAKIPGLLMWHFTDQFYHTDADRLDKVSGTTMKHVGVSALTTAWLLITADNTTAIALVKDLKASAIKRLRTELELGKANLKKGSDAEAEAHIVEVWQKYYSDVLGTMRDIPVGGASQALTNAIEYSKKEIEDKKYRLR